MMPSMSAIGPKRTSAFALHMSAIGVKRTCLVALHMSAFDTKRTSLAYKASDETSLWHAISTPVLSLRYGNEAARVHHTSWRRRRGGRLPRARSSRRCRSSAL